MRSNLAKITAALCFCLAADAVVAIEPDEESRRGSAMRIWTDTTGLHKATAALVGVDGNEAQFLKPSGKQSIIAIDRLSAADQELVRDFIRRSQAGSASDTLAPSLDEHSARAAAARVADSEKDGAADEASAGFPLGSWLKNLGAVSPTDLRARVVAKIPVLGAAASALSDDKLPPVPARVIHVQVSRAYLEKRVKRAVSEQSPVNDVIVGTPVRGTSRTSGRSDLLFVPNSKQAITDIMFSGTAHGSTVGDAGVVQIHSRSTTQFQARKRIVMDERGLQVLPTVSAARSSSATTGIATDLPRLRGRIARSIATDRVEENRSQANAEVARHVERTVKQRMDRQVAESLKPLDSLMKNPLAQLSRRQELGLKMQCSTTADHLRLCVYRADADSREVDGDLPAIAGNPPIAIWVHQSMVNRMLSDPTLQQVLQPLVGRMLKQNKLVSTSAKRTKPDVKVGWSSDGSWLTVSFGAKEHKPAPIPKQAYTFANAAN